MLLQGLSLVSHVLYLGTFINRLTADIPAIPEWFTAIIIVELIAGNRHIYSD